MGLAIIVVGGERPVDIPLLTVTDLDEYGDSLNEDLVMEAEEVGIVETVISKGSDVVGENERAEESHFDCEFEIDRLKEDVRKDYCTDSEGPSKIVGKFQKRNSTWAIIHPTKLNF